MTPQKQYWPWSKEDDQWLFALWHYSRHKAWAVAAILGRSENAVTQRAVLKGWKRVRNLPERVRDDVGTYDVRESLFQSAYANMGAI